jgi:hypothetical protein
LNQHPPVRACQVQVYFCVFNFSVSNPCQSASIRG